MPLSCHSALRKIKGETNFTFALAGNPNVGKSTIFNQLTGMGVVTANYPGTSVEVNIATTNFDNLQIGIIDLPGTYAISAISEDQWVARQAVFDGNPDVVIMIVDATNLSRNLYMVLQFLDLGLPLVIALNLVDQAERLGIRTDTKKLSEILGTPVIPTVATRGSGLSEVMSEALQVAKAKSFLSRQETRYGQDIEGPIKELANRIAAETDELPYHLSFRAVAILLLEEDKEFTKLINTYPWGKTALDAARRLSSQIEQKHGESTPLRIARERHGLAGTIASVGQAAEKRKAQASAERLWRYTTSSITGIPILLVVLVGIFAFLFSVGGFLATTFAGTWAAFVSPLIRGVIYFLFGKGIIGKTLIWGFDAGIEAALEVGIPYVLTFYLILAFLEDSGYLNAAAFLTDRIMHKVGLHGRAIIPMVAGAGCNVPAIIGTRVLATKRERTIASMLIVLIPCSARTAVILGAVSLYVGWRPAVIIYIIVLGLIALVGLGLNKIMPGQPTGLVMEMFPFRTPSLPTLLKKTWYRFKSFVLIAFPIVLVGSLLLGALYETGYIWKLAALLAPVVQGWLGLPAVAGLTLIFAVLRKELALQLLVTLAIVKYGREAANLLQFMNKNQLFVYALVNTIYIPCVATIAVLGRELGWRRAVLISVSTILLAIFIGGIANRILIGLG